MNREIKFRAWDKLSQSFIEDAMPHKARYFEQPLMQYTGLKDKNGKEIYEGDIFEIFKIKADDADAKKTLWYRYVAWNDDTSAWAVIEAPSPSDDYAMEVCGYVEEWDGDCGYNLSPKDASKREVISNIYENSKLLINI